MTEPTDTKAAKASAVVHPLDALTGGAFSAPTSGDRAAKVREWLATSPSAEQMQEVFKELSSKDKGAAKPLREKLDEIKRSHAQEHIATEWADKANALLSGSKLNIADALGWQRDAAKAGAPLSKEPLASVKTQLAERVKQIEDLQHRAQVQREAALLMAQRIEVLSTKPLADAQAAWDVLRGDVAQWQTQTDAMAQDVQWPSIDIKLAPQLDNARQQLLTLWDAFQAAVAQAVAALGDKAAPLPAVPVWAEAIRVARGEAEPRPEKVAKPKIDPEVRAQATNTVRDLLAKLEHELAEGHGKASVGAANAVRAALKEHGAHIGDKLDAAAQHALGAAGELEGWQRWRANQIREDLTVRAQALVAKPLGGRKQQDAVRQLRDAWKQTDQGGVPNHGMWKRFDDACNEAYKLVEAWLEKVKAEEGAHKAQRLVMIEEINTWASANAARTDWKDVNRELHNLSEKWRNGGHVGEKTFAELQPLYKAAIKAAHGPLEAAQTASLARRSAMIDEAKVLGAQPMMRIDAVKSLQQRWQHEAQSVPVERKQEQKLWDAFRKPIDDAFNRKSAEREQAAAVMSVHDKAVLDAVKAVDEANASGDAGKIRAAIAGLEAAARGQAAAVAADATDAIIAAKNASNSAENTAVVQVSTTQAATEIIAVALQDYLDCIASFNAKGLKVYPGSPFVAHSLLRAGTVASTRDKLKLFELHATDATALHGNIAQLEAGRMVSVERSDGFEALKALLPPPNKRALVLIDPSYEMKSDYGRVSASVQDSMKRFPTGTYAVWYPVIPRAESHDLPRRLKVLAQQAKKSWLHATLNIGMGEEDEAKAAPEIGPDGRPLRAKRPGLRESGMFIINPPHTLKASLNAALPQVLAELGRGRGKGFAVDAGG